MNTRNILGIGCALLVSACAPEFDLQGHHPNEYYAEHPIENKVETHYLTHTVHFPPSHNHIDEMQRSTIQQHFTRISPAAVDDIEIQVHPSQMHNTKRINYLKSMLSRTGIHKDRMAVVPMEEVDRHDAHIQVAYAAVVSPRCPDWRFSPTHNFTNALFTPNLGCANAVNLGLMVADPRDLVEGSGDNTPDTHSATRAIQLYRSGELEPVENGDTTGSQ